MPPDGRDRRGAQRPRYRDHAPLRGGQPRSAAARPRSAGAAARRAPTGFVRFDTLVTGDEIDHVVFDLDAKAAVTKNRPPFSVELDLGPSARPQPARQALDAAGQVVARGRDPVLNVGPHRFAVRLVEPEAGRTYKHEPDAPRRQVEVPEGERARAGRVLPQRRPGGDALPAALQRSRSCCPEPGAHLRARRRLPRRRQLRPRTWCSINAPDTTERVDVQFVELYTSVVDGRGRPVEGLAKDDFKVLEDGVAQQVRRFERVRDLPVYAGILLDTSASMGETASSTRRCAAALRFFQKVITPKDRAAVITFSDQPTLAVSFTNEETVLWPAASPGSPPAAAPRSTTAWSSPSTTSAASRASGRSSCSPTARTRGAATPIPRPWSTPGAAGVAIYTIGLDLSSRETDVRLKLSRLADETGGALLLHREGKRARARSTTPSRRSCGRSTCSPTSPRTTAAPTSSDRRGEGRSAAVVGAHAGRLLSLSPRRRPRRQTGASGG